MKLYIVRHADAGDREKWDGDDHDRPLSQLGHRQARALGDAFRQRGLAVDAVVSSPLVRTRQTAESFLQAWADGAPPTHFTDLLAPGGLRKRKLTKYVANLGVESAVLVGHDPDLPALFGWLIGADSENVYLEKGGAALVTFEDEPSRGDGRLGWVLTPEWFLNEKPEPTSA
jgi:phosphohistidine phosphatase